MIRAFKEDPNAGYQKAAYKTRQNHDCHFQQIDREVGSLPLEDVTPDQVLSWYERWSSNRRHLWMGYAVLNRVRTLIRYGRYALEEANCTRLDVALCVMRIKNGTSNFCPISAEQAEAVRVTAHKKKLPSIALAQAFISDLKLGQKQVIGEWLPLSEPGASDIENNSRKWLSGLDWSQIGKDLILSIEVGDKIKKIDLKRAPMVMAELNLLGKIPKHGPVIVYEKTRLPYAGVQFRREWRFIATAAGIPKSSRNRHYQTRRTGGDGVVTTTEKTTPNMGAPALDSSKVLEFINRLCKPLSEHIREDIAQEMSVDVLAGKVTIDELAGLRAVYVKKHYKSYDNRFAVNSWDEPNPGTGKTLGDTISSSHEVWK